MINAIVFTEQSLYRFNIEADPVSILNPVFDGNSYYSFNINNIGYIISKGNKDKDIKACSLIIIRDLFSFSGHNEAGLRTLLQRLHKFSHQVAVKSSSVPSSWSPFHMDNKISFLAFDVTVDNSRVVTEIMTNGRHDLLVHGLAKPNKRTDIANHNYAYSEYQAVLSQLEIVQNKISEKEAEAAARGMEDSFQLSVSIIADKIVYSFDDWQNRLSPVQLEFVNRPINTSMKIKGPAGSGKTVAMTLKALKLLREDTNVRILYLTHSWTVADHVQSFIESIEGDQNLIKRIDIFPLLTLAESSINKISDAELLGDDSLSGKMQQLDIIRQIAIAYFKDNQVLFEPRCSKAFFQRFLANDQSDQQSLFWDLMIEFACVIGANGILPGIGALEKYLEIERRKWMMPLATNGDKELVLKIYVNYTKKLLSERKITTDQIINDYLNFLSTNRWLYDRPTKGYDCIFVDETQLFNDQERMVFHFLSNNADEYPKIVMAIDPKQSVNEVFFNHIDRYVIVSKEDNPLPEESLGEVSHVQLGDIFRYTQPILDFLKHVDKSFPALNLGDDWDNQIATSTSKIKKGNKPQFILTSNSKDLIKKVLLKASECLSSNNRVAVLCLDDSTYKLLKESNTNDKVQWIESSNDTLKLQYIKRALIISQPTYVIGLQFDVVILVGCTVRFRDSDSDQAYRLRRFVADLYLGASRASTELFLFASSDAGNIPVLISKAKEKSLLYTTTEDL